MLLENQNVHDIRIPAETTSEKRVTKLHISNRYLQSS